MYQTIELIELSYRLNHLISLQLLYLFYLAIWEGSRLVELAVPEAPISVPAAPFVFQAESWASRRLQRSLAESRTESKAPMPITAVSQNYTYLGKRRSLTYPLQRESLSLSWHYAACYGPNYGREMPVSRGFSGLSVPQEHARLSCGQRAAARAAFGAGRCS